jgi:hypothetical protein
MSYAFPRRHTARERRAAYDMEHLIEGACPECRGPLTEVRDGDIVEFRCLVGHRYSPVACSYRCDSQWDELWEYVYTGGKTESPMKLNEELVHAAIDGFNAQKLRIDSQIAELRAMLSGSVQLNGEPEPAPRKRRRMSAAARRRIAAAQRAR